MKCKNCKWFCDMTIFGKNKRGHCYFYPPTPKQIPFWSEDRPEVKGNDYCSKYAQTGAIKIKKDTK